MHIRHLLQSEGVAWAAGAVAVLIATVVAYAYVGWLGIGIVGLIGLLISTRLSLHDGHAVADSDHGSGAVGHLSRQVNERDSRVRPEDKMAALAEKDAGGRRLFHINTAFIAMTALGLGLFVLHQL